MERIVSLFGLMTMMFLAWLLSDNRRRMNTRLILSGVAIQFILAFLIFWTSPGRLAFSYAGNFVTGVVGFSNAGAEFIFGTSFKEHFFAFSVLLTIIFVSSLMAVPRREDFAKMGLRAMIGGSLAAFMTATIAGILI